MYVRTMSAYPGPRVRLRGLGCGVPMLTTDDVMRYGRPATMGQDDDDDEIGTLPLDSGSYSGLTTAPAPTIPLTMPSPAITPSYPSASQYPSTAAPTIATLPFSTAQIAALSPAQPSVLNASVPSLGGTSVSSIVVIGGLALLAIAALGAGARR
jgi:hypothetical protein